MATTVGVIMGVLGALMAASIGYFVAENILSTALNVNKAAGGTVMGANPMFGIALFLMPVIVVAAATFVVLQVFGGGQ